MNKNLLLSLWKYLLRIPLSTWQGEVAGNAESGPSRISFMSGDHHKIRDFVVLEIPRRGAPIAPEDIARAVEIPLQRTREILDELEKGMTFLFRNAKGEVAWAYPVTAEATPHRMRFSSGEIVYAA
jgi:hypothetical protein